MRILLVDDDDTVRNLLEMYLRGRGHEVTACADGESALAALEEGYFPLIILDWYLPGVDGLEVCERIRAGERGRDCIVLVFTSAGEMKDLQRVMEAGADDYMSKPLDPILLEVRLSVAERHVEELLALRRAEAERDLVAQRLKASHAELRSILDKLRLGTLLVDSDGLITFASESVERLFSVSREAIIGQPWSEAIPFRPGDQATLLAQALLPESERLKVQARTRHQDDRFYWMEVEVRDAPHGEGGTLFVIYDMTEVEDLRRRLGGQEALQELVGESEAMKAAFQQIQELARFDTTALLEGETGTGKELAARAIHRLSDRRDGPFVAVNCASIHESLVASQLFGHRRGAFTGAVEDQKGVFESAEGGTLFLDEIGDIPPSVQMGLLRVLQEREITRVGEHIVRKVDVRVIAATHRNLMEEVEQGRFRQDLLYRVRVARLRLPPLSERGGDTHLLSATFLQELAASLGKPVTGFSPEVMAILMDYSWPGNVRELRSTIESALIRCPGSVILPSHLPPEILDEARKKAKKSAVGLAPEDERGRILQALKETNGSRTAAARRLGMSRATFYRRLDTLGIVLS